MNKKLIFDWQTNIFFNQTCYRPVQHSPSTKFLCWVHSEARDSEVKPAEFGRLLQPAEFHKCSWSKVGQLQTSFNVYFRSVLRIQVDASAHSLYLIWLQTK